MAHTIQEYEEFLKIAYEAIDNMKVQIQVLQARREEQSITIDTLKLRLEMMNTGLARLKVLLNDPPWEKI